MAKSFYLKHEHVADLSEDDQEALSNALGLSEDQEASLFGDEKTIKVTEDQANTFKAWYAERQEQDGEQETETETSDKKDEVAEADMIDISTASQRDRNAIEIGRKLTSGTTDVLREGWEAREKVNITPLLVRQRLVDDAKAGKFDLNELPFPGSYVKGGQTVVGTGDNVRVIGSNAPFDKYTYRTQNDKGDSVKKSGSYYDSMFRATALGKSLETERDLIVTALMSSRFKEKGGECPAEYKNKDKPQLIRRRKLVDSRIRYGFNTLKKAVEFHMQCHAFDSLKQVDYSFETEQVDGKETYVNRNEPVQIFAVTFNDPKYPQGKPGTPSNVSIGAFLRYDVAKAIAKAGGADKVTLEHIEGTTERDRGNNKQSATASDWSKTAINTVAEFENVMSSVAAYIATDDGDVNGKHMTAIENRIAEKDGEEFLLVMGDACTALDSWWAKNEKAYQIAAAKRNASLIAERQAKSKAAA